MAVVFFISSALAAAVARSGAPTLAGRAAVSVRAIPTCAFTPAGGPRRTAVSARAIPTMDGAALDGEYARVAAMSVGDIKSELELRGVDFSGCFEKDDLIRRLVLARQQGEADPSIVDKFNTDTLERSFRREGSEPAEDEPDPFEVAQAEGVDVLPGGMSPELVKKLASNPELMAVLQNPRMQAVLKDVMASGPVAFAKYMGDPEVMAMIAVFQKAMAS